MVSLYDAVAERAVAGCAVASAEGSRLACERLDAEDFYDPALGRLVDLSSWVAADPGRIDDLELADEARAREVAAMADRPRTWVLGIVRSRLSLVDASGAMADRVKAAAGRRRQAFELVDQLDALGVAVTIEEAA